MSEFEDREKAPRNLGELTDDISRERGEIPFKKFGTNNPNDIKGNVPPDVMQRRRRGISRRDDKDANIADIPVVSVFSTRPVNATDFRVPFSNRQTIIQDGIEFGDLISTVVSATEGTAQSGFTGATFYNGAFYTSEEDSTNERYIRQYNKEGLFVRTVFSDNIGSNFFGDLQYIPGNNEFWITEQNASSTIRIYTPGGTFIGTVSFPAGSQNFTLRGLVIDFENSKLYFSESGNNDIYSADVNISEKSVSNVELLTGTSIGARTIAISLDGSVLYFVESGGEVKAVDSSTGTELDSSSLGMNIFNIAGVDENGYFYVFDFDSGNNYAVTIYKYSSFYETRNQNIAIDQTFTVPDGWYAALSNFSYGLKPIVGGISFDAIKVSLLRNNSPLPYFNKVNMPATVNNIPVHLIGESGDDLTLRVHIEGGSILLQTEEEQLTVYAQGNLYGTLIPYDGAPYEYSIASRKK